MKLPENWKAACLTCKHARTASEGPAIFCASTIAAEGALRQDPGQCNPLPYCIDVRETGRCGATARLWAPAPSLTPQAL